MLRIAYPDEYSRIKSIMQGVPVPPNAQFLVEVKEHPVERIIAVFVWWLKPKRSTPNEEKGEDQQITPENMIAEFSMHSAGASSITDALLKEAISTIEEKIKGKVSALSFQGPLLEESAIFKKLVDLEFSIAQTDKHYRVAGDSMKQRCLSLYEKLKSKIPSDWSIESIRGHNAEEVWNVIAEHGLISPHQFKNYWDGSSREHFEEDYSSVVLVDGKIIGALLVTMRGDSELHIHVDAVKSSHSKLSNVATLMMRNFMSAHCSEGFPQYFTFQADSDKHTQTQNSAIRFDGEELEDRHLLSKKIV